MQQQKTNIIMRTTTIVLLIIILGGCSSSEKYDILIKNGQIIDGSGLPSYTGDVGINADTIAKIGNLRKANGYLSLLQLLLPHRCLAAVYFPHP